MIPNRSGRFLCDDCKQWIDEPQHGRLAWIVNTTNGDARKPQIVHVPEASPLEGERRRLSVVGSRTPHGPRVCGSAPLGLSEQRLEIPLAHLLDADGLMQLLALIAERRLPLAALLEIIQRLHVPQYEDARPYLSLALRKGIIRPNMPSGFYWQGELADVLRLARLPTAQ